MINTVMKNARVAMRTIIGNWYSKIREQVNWMMLQPYYLRYILSIGLQKKSIKKVIYSLKRVCVAFIWKISLPIWNKAYLFFQGYRYKPNQLYLWAHKLCVYCCVIVFIHHVL
jgi:hypothetical protein